MNTIVRTSNALQGTLIDVENCSTLDEVLDTANLDYEVRLQELSSQVLTDTGVTRVDYTQMGVVRMDNYAPLGVVGERYTPIQNRDAFEPLRYLHGEGFIEAFEQAGVINQGQRAFIIARLSQGIRLTDEHRARVIFSTTHDGSGSYSVRAIAERLYCKNQIPRLHKIGKRVTAIKHTQSATHRVQQVRAMVLSEVRWFDEYAEQYWQLTSISADAGDTSAFVDLVAPLPPAGKATDRQVRAAEKRQRELMGRINGPTNTNIAGTFAALFQGAVEYSDYDARGNNAERILLGRDVDFKTRAWDTALAMSGAA